MHRRICFLAVFLLSCAAAGQPADDRSAANRPPALQPLRYNHPGLSVELGVGLWAIPMPMDYDGDGDNDLVVVSVGKPKNGIYFFENAEGRAAKLPVLRPGVRIDRAVANLQVSYMDGEPRVLRVGEEYVDFRGSGLSKPVKLPVDTDVHATRGRIRANQWRYVDYDGDGHHDLVVGIGDWTEYGWDDAFDAQGNWTNGPLRGLVYLLHNTGTDERPAYAPPVAVEAGGAPVDVFGMPGPCFDDFDGDGDLDLICGEFVDRLTYFENVGSRTSPRYASGRQLSAQGQTLTLETCMITPVAYDWDQDGDADLVVGEEDGSVALVENTGRVVDGLPVFSPPVRFRQQADKLKSGALVNPVAHDLDGDGDQDLVCGNAAGYITFFENLGGGAAPRWTAPVPLEAAGQVIRIQAGPNGSIQGPAESKWGYTTLSVADWDHDGLPDLIVNSIWGRVVWFRNLGPRTRPSFDAERAVEVEWAGPAPKPEWLWWNPGGRELVTQWRTTPVVVDATADGLNDLVMLDRDGFLSLFERRRSEAGLALLPPRRVFFAEPSGASVLDHNNRGVSFDGNADGVNDLAVLDAEGRLPFFTMNPMGNRENVMNRFASRADDAVYAASATALTPLRLNAGWAGRSGRRKLALVDLDRDGRLDLLLNSVNVTFFRNVAKAPGEFVFRDMGPLDSAQLAGHTTSPSIADLDADGTLEILVGAEDGFIYSMQNPVAPARAERGNP